MPSWLMESGTHVLTIGWTETLYMPIAGWLCIKDTEAKMQTRIRDSYTWARLYVRVTANTRTANCPITSRINAGAGNQTITVPAATSGVFEDNVNSDNIVNNDLVNWRIEIIAGAGSISLSVVSSSFTAAGNVTLLIASTEGETMTFGITRYATVLGILDAVAAEADVQLLVRQASTLSNLRVYIGANNVNAASILRLRVNGANVNQILNIPDSNSGDFEDVVNTDSIVSGNRIDYQIITGGAFGNINLDHLQMKSAAPNRWLGYAYAHGEVLNDSLTYYIVGEGRRGDSNVEAEVQTETRVAITLKNLFVRVLTNTLDSISTLRTRKNGGNGNLNVSIGALATGEFEDTVNSDSYIATDLYNFELVTGGSGVQTVEISIISVEEQSTPLAPGAPQGANMASKMIAGNLI